MNPEPRTCDWCAGPIPGRARVDAVCCSTRCRQARHRFNTNVGQAAQAGATAARGIGSAVESGPSLRLAYADPPYPGKAYLYREHPDYAGEVDHADLIRRLCSYDGWALSTSAHALPAVLAVCPPGVRVAAWHRGARAARSWRPANAWEPVIYHGGRGIDPSRPAGGTRRVDSLVLGVSVLTTLPSRVMGTKPAGFCRWVFDLLGARPGDALDDLFPGSGAVAKAFTTYVQTTDLSTAPNVSSPAGADASVPPAHDTSTPPTGHAVPVASAGGHDASRLATHDAYRRTG